MSPTGVLLAAFGLVLSRWGAGGPFCLNTTLFDRPDDPELAHLVGDFTSTLLVEVPEPGTRGFADFAARVNRRFWTDMEHRAVSGVEVLRDAGSTDLTPTHPVVFTSGLGLSDPERDPAGWLGEEVFGISQTPQVALDHIVHDEGDGCGSPGTRSSERSPTASSRACATRTCGCCGGWPPSRTPGTSPASAGTRACWRKSPWTAVPSRRPGLGWTIRCARPPVPCPASGRARLVRRSEPRGAGRAYRAHRGCPGRAGRRAG
ncbi:hypothetical protein [Actinomadura madurae]|uniref:hypothetical protein n=1 Tax=Actinomadura madurae TaxID=1993 RepID=UPI003558C74A